jgi:adenylylsulfate kinase-like enzyme
VATPLAECERRDAKGLYARARAGQIPGFTGLDDPYEPPPSPALVLDTTGRSVEETADQVLQHLAQDGEGRERPSGGGQRSDVLGRSPAVR